MSDRAPSPASPPAPTPQPIPEPDVTVKEEESAMILSSMTTVVQTEPISDVPSALPVSSTTSAAQTEPISDVPSALPVSSMTTIAQIEPIPDAPSVLPVSPSRYYIRRTEGQRRAMLKNDPQVEAIDPRRVLCRVCQQWIKLSPTCNYTLANWQAHKQRCTAATPSRRSALRTPTKPNFSPNSRVATAERRIVLLNDPQVKVFFPRRVHCSSCMSVVELGGEVDYELTKWTEHKGKCIPMVPAPITPQGLALRRSHDVPPQSTSSTHSQVSADGSRRSPTPACEGPSAEPAAATDDSPAAVKAETKRGREEDDEAEAERPANRPRVETYEPPELAAPSILGWFMQPLKEFARGFREGLGST